jgi:hypothetical protein
VSVEEGLARLEEARGRRNGARNANGRCARSGQAMFRVVLRRRANARCLIGESSPLTAPPWRPMLVNFRVEVLVHGAHGLRGMPVMPLLGVRCLG